MIPNETREMKLWITDIEYNGLYGSISIWKTIGKKEYLIIHSSREDLFNEEGHNILTRLNKSYDDVIATTLAGLIRYSDYASRLTYSKVMFDWETLAPKFMKKD